MLTTTHPEKLIMVIIGANMVNIVRPRLLLFPPFMYLTKLYMNIYNIPTVKMTISANNIKNIAFSVVVNVIGPAKVCTFL